MKLILACLIALAAQLPSAAQIPEIQKTGGLLNCSFWNARPSEPERINFVIGFIEMQKIFEAVQQAESTVPDATYGEISKGVTAICAQPENAHIWFCVAMMAFGEQIRGASPAEVEALLEPYRRKISDERFGKVDVAPQRD
ncbi:MAG: hypothetical protein JWO19_4480 [Bryobacterales bacterium]|nr:hypothetical protein [Bryobacterales bacterium]